MSSTAQEVTDPYTVHTPMYAVTMTVFTDTPANLSTPVYKDTFSTTFAPDDQLRAGLQAYRRQGTTLTPASQPITCMLGDTIDRGLLPAAVLTQPGHQYSTCAASPDVPDQVGLPMTLGAPVELGADDTLYLYARLEVLNSGEVVALSPSNDAGVPGGLKNLGAAYERAGEIVGIIPGAGELGDLVQGIGGVLRTIGEVATSDQRSNGGCAVTNSLVPGFGNGEPTSDTPSPILRAAMSGSELWADTANGDAVLEYSLDWGTYAQTHLCSRPKTRVVFRVRRVVAEGVPGDPVFTRGGVIDASDPTAYDAFTVDGAKNVIHDQWHTNTWVRSTEYLPSRSYQGSCGPYGCYGGYFPVFPAGAHITAVAKGSAQQDIFAISAAGKLVNNWRNQGWDNNNWHTWVDHSGAYFPPGAPVAAISRNPGHIDIFAIATDGSIMTSSWDSQAGWAADATHISPAGMFKPWNGTNGGGVAAMSAGIAPYSAISVFAAGNRYELVQISWTLFGGWRLQDDAGVPTPDVWYTPGGDFVALQRNPNRTDLLFVDAYGHGRAIWYDNGWQTQQITPDAMPLVRGGAVAAVARKVDVTLDPYVDNDHMDFFSVGTDGAIVRSTWVAGQNGDTWASSYASKIPTIVAQPGGPIGAVSTNPGSIQVSARKPDGTLAHAWFA
ncbi:MAG TPA: hypothetical protein VFQ65_16815, partial [Kofleriaceae bacterium]|nr:hypothetical protein [Kofleriaceae bacterium]